MMHGKIGDILEKLKLKIKNYDDKQSEVLRIIILVAALGIVMFCAEESRNIKAEVVIWGVTVFSAAALLVLYDIFDLELYQFAFLGIMVMGGLSLLIQPILNVPDEVAHFARSEIVSQGQLIINRSQQEFMTIQSMDDLHKQCETAIIYSVLKGTKIDYTPYYFYHVAATNATFLYIPQAVGMIIAKILNLDVIWLMWLGRFMNLLVYSILVGLAIKITPCIKFSLLFVAILPMSIQQAASLSPDAMINALSILLIALFSYLYTKDIISYKEIIFFIVIGMLTVISKVTNMCITGLFLLLPLHRTYGKNRAVILKICVVGSFIITGMVYYYYTTTFAVNTGVEKYCMENNVDSGRQLHYIFGNFKQWLQDFGGSALEQSESYINMLNRFGWLNYGYAALTSMTVFMFAKVCLQEKQVIISRLHKFLIFLMVVGTYMITSLALYLTWTPVGAENTAGVQGRYFIPLISLVILLVCNAGNERSVHKNKNDMAVMLGMVSSYLLVTAARYY